MLNIVLVFPEIPPNTGNIMRLARNTGAKLHLIKPLGFDLDDRRMKRAGLDYQDTAVIYQYSGWDAYLDQHGASRRFTFSTKANLSYAEVQYRQDDHLVFGSETKGLPDAIRVGVPADRQVTLPMTVGSRSLNLSNSVAIATYEAWRQTGFPGATL